MDELDENIKTLIQLYIKNLKDEISIEFDKFKNLKYFNMNAKVKYFANVKNVKDQYKKLL